MKNEKIKQIAEKTKELTKKLNKKAVIAFGAVLILAVAVLLNFLLVPKNNLLKTSKLKTAVDLTDVSAALNEKEKTVVDNTDKTDAFAEMSLSRRQARDEAIEVLNCVVDGENSVDAMKEEAVGEIEQIAKNIECEANIEGLIKSKGFEECVAVVNGDMASVVVKSEGLMQNEVAQISEIVWEQAGVRPENLRIIESN